MKNIMMVIAIMFSSSLTMACESNQFNVYYLPLDIDLYTPPSREDIMKNGISFEIDSCLLKDLFEAVYSQKGVEPLQEDYTGLRIMVVNKKITMKYLLLQTECCYHFPRKKI